MGSHMEEELQERYPVYFEKFLRSLKLPVWVGGPALGLVLGGSFIAADIIAGLSTVRHLIVVTALLISISLAPILTVYTRNKGVAAFLNLLPIIPSSDQRRFMGLLNKAFGLKRSIIFALFVGTGGVLHHIILSYLEWGRIWWYSVLDITLVGFVWWFVVAAFLWLCLSVAVYSYVASKQIRFRPTIFSHTRMCGLESFGTLSVIPAVAWGTVAAFGTLSTFDPFVLKQLPQFILAYLGLDFLIAASSMTVIFSLPVLGYRAIVLPLKHSLSIRLIQAMKSKSTGDDLVDLKVTNNAAVKQLYLWELLAQTERLKEWPLRSGESVKFILSYLIPAAVYIGRLILLLGVRIQIPS